MLEVLMSYFKGFAIVGALTWVSKYTAFYFVTKRKDAVTPTEEMWLKALGGSFLFVAGISKLGWKIQSWGGESPREQFNDWLFWILSVVGTFCIFLEIFITYEKSKKKQDCA